MEAIQWQTETWWRPPSGEERHTGALPVARKGMVEVTQWQVEAWWRLGLPQSSSSTDEISLCRKAVKYLGLIPWLQVFAFIPQIYFSRAATPIKYTPQYPVAFISLKIT